MRKIIPILFLCSLIACDADDEPFAPDLTGEWNFLAGGIGDTGFYPEEGASATFSFSSENYNIEYFLPVVENGVHTDTIVKSETGKFILLNTTYVDGQIPGTTVGWGGNIEFSPDGGINWNANFRTSESDDQLTLDFTYEGQVLLLVLQQ